MKSQVTRMIHILKLGSRVIMVKVEELPSKFRSSKTIEVIVTYYSDFEGRLLAVNDPCPGGKHAEEDRKQPTLTTSGTT